MRYVSIPGYAKEYRISEEGIIQSKRRNGKWATVKARVERSQLQVKLYRKDGTRHSRSVKSLMRDCFLGGPREGYRLTNANSMISDCSIYNLKWVKQSQLHKIHGHKSRKPVVKVDRYGAPLAYYSSIHEAAAKNYVSIACVSRRCNKVIKDPFRYLDFDFKFER